MKGARFLSAQEIREISQSFAGKYSVRDRGLFLLGVHTGCRISELLSLDVQDVWEFNQPLDILELKRGITKNHKTRQIPLNQWAKEAIRELVGENPDPQRPLFPSRKGGRLSRFRADKILREVFISNQCAGRVSSHSMRKTFAQSLLNAGCNLMLLRELLGHSSLAVTQKYLCVSQTDLTRAVGLLNFAG